MNTMLCHRNMAERPPPRGRAALIEAFKSRLTKPGGDSASQPEEPKKPLGRAALIARMKELQIGRAGPSTEGPSAVEEPKVPKKLVPEEQSQDKPELPVCSFKGK